jgi:dynein heavy chain
MMEVVGPWQLKSWGQAQAGNRASKTGCYLLWRDINPECNAGISHGQQLRRLGDTWVPYNDDFKFIITTKMANPHYLPEICIKVTVINFTVTPEGLEDQLLVDVVKYERPELEQQKDQLVVQLSEFKRQLQDTEAKILKLVSEASDDILDDEELIVTLD